MNWEKVRDFEDILYEKSTEKARLQTGAVLNKLHLQALDGKVRVQTGAVMERLLFQTLYAKA